MEFSKAAKSGHVAGNGGFGGLRLRADGAWAATGMAVEGLLEGERRMSTAGRAWPCQMAMTPSCSVLVAIRTGRGHRQRTCCLCRLTDGQHFEPALSNGARGRSFAGSFLRRQLIAPRGGERARSRDRKSTRLNSSHLGISYAV